MSFCLHRISVDVHDADTKNPDIVRHMLAQALQDGLEPALEEIVVIMDKQEVFATGVLDEQIVIGGHGNRWNVLCKGDESPLPHQFGDCLGCCRAFGVV